MKKSQITKDAELTIKNRHAAEKAAQKENNMKNITNSPKFTTIKHVTLTLLTLAAIGAIFYTGFTYGEKHERGQDAYIQAQVEAKVLSAKTQVEASK